MSNDLDTHIKSKNINFEKPSITLDQRVLRNKHKSCVIWMTGLSGSGKSTIARKLMHELFNRDCQVTTLDGDNVRHGLCSDLAFSVEERYEHLRRIAEVSRLFYENGTITICSFISPYADCRNFARSIIPAGFFFETFVKCDIEICKKRDPKGLYKKVRDGVIKGFTGIDAPYEEPLNPELQFDTNLQPVDEIVTSIINTLITKKIIPNAGKNVS